MNRSPWARAMQIGQMILLTTLLCLMASDAEAQDTLVTRIGLSYENSSFQGSGGLTPWHEMSLQLSRRTPRGTLIGRVNLAERFGKQAAQLEIDAYPRLGPGRYAFVNIGVAGDALYPSLRASLEVWQGLPGSFEGSLGVRYLRFSTDVILYTGSLAYYTGDYWIAARPWIRSRNGDFSVSTNLKIRKYGADRYDYLGLGVGIGSGIGDLDTSDELDRLRSYRVGFELRKPFSAQWSVKARTTLDWEELVRDRLRTRFRFSFGLERGF